MARSMIIVVAAVSVLGCSKGQRDEVIDRTARAAQELNGKSTSVAKKQDIPTVVSEQQLKEIIRQNTQWTKENQALHPVEYCQAQLVELDKMSKLLQVHVHSTAAAKAAACRKSDDARSQIESFVKLLREAKSAYRLADEANQWPMMFHGFQLSKELAEQRIIEIADRIRIMKETALKSSNQITALEKKAVWLEDEQRKIVVVRERVQSVLTDLKTKQIIDGVNNISDALNDISDSMAALVGESQEVTIDELVLVESSNEKARRFKEIMTEE